METQNIYFLHSNCVISTIWFVKYCQFSTSTYIFRYFIIFGSGKQECVFCNSYYWFAWKTQNQEFDWAMGVIDDSYMTTGNIFKWLLTAESHHFTLRRRPCSTCRRSSPTATAGRTGGEIAKKRLAETQESLSAEVNRKVRIPAFHFLPQVTGGPVLPTIIAHSWTKNLSSLHICIDDKMSYVVFFFSFLFPKII